MPRTMTYSQIMQPAGERHHKVSHCRLPIAHLLFDDPAALHTAHRLLNPHLLARYPMILCILLNCQFSTTRFLCWLLDQDVLNCKSLKSYVLVQHTSGRKHIRFIIHKRFIMPFSSIRPTQKPYLTGRIDQQNVLDRVTLLLAAVILLFFRI